MAYQIDRFNRTLLTVVADGTIDETTDLRFIGKNFAGYGEIHNENFLYLLENFSSANAPPKPISGQVWFDSAQSKLKFYDGTIWRTTGGSEVTQTEPAGLTEGDFWWDSLNDQLYVFNGGSFVLIGPQATGNTGVTQLVSQTLLSNQANQEPVIVAFIGDEPVFVISTTEFTIDSSESITDSGFTKIIQGITLKDTPDSGITDPGSSYRFWGTASNSNMLAGNPASDFVQFTNPTFNDQVVANGGVDVSSALVLGTVNSGTDGDIRNNVTNGSLQFRVTDSGNTLLNVVNITSNAFVPGVNNTIDLGSNTLRFREIWAETYSGGAATRADSLLVSSLGTYQTASVASSPDTVVVRDANEVIFAEEFNGTASSAKYADLAEKYTTDKEYPVGTIMCVGGLAETTAASWKTIAIGVISQAPAYLMNSEAEGQAIALKGRVPVRVTGPVTKGQIVYATSDGVGTAAPSSGVVGIALEDSPNDADENLIECILKV